MARKTIFSILIGLVLVLTTGGFAQARIIEGMTWEQVNAPDIVIPGQQFTALEEFQGQLYAGTENTFYTGTEPQLTGVWRSADGRSWNQVFDTGLLNWLHFGRFKEQLYVGGTSIVHDNWDIIFAGHIWRTADGTSWDEVVSDGFGDPNNAFVANFTEFKEMLYISTDNFDMGWGLPVTGTQIWRSPSGEAGTWEKVFTVNKPELDKVTSFYQFKGELYAAMEGAGPFQLWRTADGLAWEQVGQDGFGDPNATSPGSLLEWRADLYMGAGFPGLLWRSTDGDQWVPVVGPWTSDPQNYKVESLVAYMGDLVLVTDNGTGLIVWRTSDGQNWDQISEPGFGNPNNMATQWSTSVRVFKGDLYMGTAKFTLEDTAGEIWRLSQP